LMGARGPPSRRARANMWTIEHGRPMHDKHGLHVLAIARPVTTDRLFRGRARQGRDRLVRMVRLPTGPGFGRRSQSVCCRPGSTRAIWRRICARSAEL
jgi:hypothetical protein